MKLGSIQMLRALAALMVVYAHSVGQVGIFAAPRQQQAPICSALGTFGVDLFFVISGFVITYSSNRLNGRNAALAFCRNRFRRINPVYYVATLLTLIVWLPSLLRHRHPGFSGGRILASATLLPLTNDSDPIIFQAWSLQFEWYFYLLFFLLILFGVQKKEIVLGTGIGILILLGGLLYNRPIGLLGFYTDPVIFEFFLGVCIAFAYKRWTPGKKTALGLLLPGIFFGLGLMLTGYCNSLVLPATPMPSLRYLHAFYWGGAAALIVAGCVFLEKPRTSTFFHNRRVILLLGDASYSIYLFHMLVFGAIAAVFFRTGFFLPPDLAVPIEAAIAAAGSLLFYRWVEIPLLKWLKKEDPSRLTPSPPAGT